MTNLNPMQSQPMNVRQSRDYLQQKRREIRKQGLLTNEVLTKKQGQFGQEKGTTAQQSKVSRLWDRFAEQVSAVVSKD